MRRLLRGAQPGTARGVRVYLSSPGASVEAALRKRYPLAGIPALENRWRGWLDAQVR